MGQSRQLRSGIQRFAGDAHFFSTLFRIAVPMALQNLITSSVNMADTVMVGRLGSTALAAVGLGNQVYFLFLLLLFGIGSGAGVFIAQYWGKKDIPGIRRVTGLSLALGLGASFFFLILSMAAPRLVLGLYSRDPAVLDLGAGYLRIVSASYPAIAISFLFSLALRGVEQVKLPLAATTVSLGFNVLLNWALIFGKLGFPALGVRGAAIATVISRLIETSIILAAVYAKRFPPAGNFRELTSWNRAFNFRYAAIALPVVANEVIWSLGITFFNGVFARMSTGAIAAFNVQVTIAELAQVLFIGTANASAVMLGKRIGQGNQAGAYDWANRFAVLGIILGAGMGLLLIPVRGLVPLLFPLEPEILLQARRMILCLAATFPFKVFNLHLVVGICRSGGDTKFGVFYDIFGVWAVGVPMALLGAFVWRLEPWLVFLLLCSDEVAKFSLGVWRLTSRKWLRDVTV